MQVRTASWRAVSMATALTLIAACGSDDTAEPAVSTAAAGSSQSTDTQPGDTQPGDTQPGDTQPSDTAPATPTRLTDADLGKLVIDGEAWDMCELGAAAAAAIDPAHEQGAPSAPFDLTQRAVAAGLYDGDLGEVPVTTRSEGAYRCSYPLADAAGPFDAINAEVVTAASLEEATGRPVDLAAYVAERRAEDDDAVDLSGFAGPAWYRESFGAYVHHPEIGLLSITWPDIAPQEAAEAALTALVTAVLERSDTSTPTAPVNVPAAAATVVELGGTDICAVITSFAAANLGDVVLDPAFGYHTTTTVNLLGTDYPAVDTTRCAVEPADKLTGGPNLSVALYQLDEATIDQVMAGIPLEPMTDIHPGAIGNGGQVVVDLGTMLLIVAHSPDGGVVVEGTLAPALATEVITKAGL